MVKALLTCVCCLCVCLSQNPKSVPPQPAYVFPGNLGNGNVKYVIEVGVLTYCLVARQTHSQFLKMNTKLSMRSVGRPVHAPQLMLGGAELCCDVL